MKNLVYLTVCLIFCSCGKKYTFECVGVAIPGKTPPGTVIEPYTAQMTKREARNYEKEHSVADKYNIECSIK